MGCAGSGPPPSDGLGGAATSLQAGYAVRSGLSSAESACQGVFAGYAIEGRFVGLAPRIAACRSGYDNSYLHGSTDELGLELRGAHAWDAGDLTVSVGVTAGGSLLRQHFDSTGLAPSRNALAAHLGILAGATVDLVQGFYGGIELDAMTYFFQQQAMEATRVSAPFAMRLNVLLIGKRW